MAAKRNTIPYGVTPTDRQKPVSGSRRRSSSTSKTLSGPLEAPAIPEHLTSPTAVTQPMPAVEAEADETMADTVPPPPAHPVIPPPPKAPAPDGARARSSLQASKAGVYRYTVPEPERRKKQRS
jgi:hypothetical protein